MFTLTKTLLIMNFLTLIYAPDTKASLKEVLIGQELPLILFPLHKFLYEVGSYHHILQIPTSVDETVVVHEEIVQGTQFAAEESKQQLFFCPMEDSDKKCLVPRKFEHLKPLKCARQAMPTVQEDITQGPCGIGKTGTAYNVFYDICSKEEANRIYHEENPFPEDSNENPYKYITDRVPLYGFCYDKTEKKTLFIINRIPVPKLLRANSLVRERDVKYPFFVNDQIKPQNFEAINRAIAAETTSSTDTDTKKPVYKVQQLIPHEHMAFALWKKSTYQYINADLQHAALIPLWNKITDMIVSSAIQMYDRGIGYSVYTTVYDIHPNPAPSSHESERISNIWVKAIYAKTLEENLMVDGIAIIMNNYLSPGATFNDKDDLINGFCPENLCAKSLLDEFAQVHGHVHCCPLCHEVRILFGDLSNIHAKVPVSKIPGITKGTDDVTES